MKAETKQPDNIVEVMDVGIYFSNKCMFSLQILDLVYSQELQ